MLMYIRTLPSSAAPKAMWREPCGCDRTARTESGRAGSPSRISRFPPPRRPRRSHPFVRGDLIHQSLQLALAS